MQRTVPKTLSVNSMSFYHASKHYMCAVFTQKKKQLPTNGMQRSGEYSTMHQNIICALCLPKKETSTNNQNAKK